jgi:hypothetical protein
MLSLCDAEGYSKPSQRAHILPPERYVMLYSQSSQAVLLIVVRPRQGAVDEEGEEAAKLRF